MRKYRESAQKIIRPLYAEERSSSQISMAPHQLLPYDHGQRWAYIQNTRRQEDEVLISLKHSIVSNRQFTASFWLNVKRI